MHWEVNVTSETGLVFKDKVRTAFLPWQSLVSVGVTLYNNIYAVVRKLIVDNADLAEKFGYAQTVQRLHLDVSKQKWQYSYPIKKNDITAGAEVIPRLQGVKAARDWLRRWNMETCCLKKKPKLSKV